jgi:hypothetical protein
MAAPICHACGLPILARRAVWILPGWFPGQPQTPVPFHQACVRRVRHLGLSGVFGFAVVMLVGAQEKHGFPDGADVAGRVGDGDKHPHRPGLASARLPHGVMPLR